MSHDSLIKSGDSWLRASTRQSCDMPACIEARYSVPRGELVHSGYDDKRPPLCPRTGFPSDEVDLSGEEKGAGQRAQAAFEEVAGAGAGPPSDGNSSDDGMSVGGNQGGGGDAGGGGGRR